MARGFVLVITSPWIATGTFIIATPRVSFAVTPGVAATGPFNDHFIRDVGLAFVASGALRIGGVVRRELALLLAEASWPLLHAGFHLLMRVRAPVLDPHARFDFPAVIFPSVAVALCAGHVTAAHVGSVQA